MPESVNAATASTVGSQGVAAASKTDLDMNAFLVMFTTQLQHQDPTNPLKSHELAAQLAQFTSVQKLTELNAGVQRQTQLLASVHHGQMLALLGRTVTAVSDAVKLTDGAATPFGFTLKSPARVTAAILAPDGTPVRRLDLGGKAAGTHELAWDGKNEEGAPLPDGTYTVRLSAVDADGNAVSVLPRVSGVVRALRFDAGNPVLTLDTGAEVPIEAVSEVTA